MAGKGKTIARGKEIEIDRNQLEAAKRASPMPTGAGDLRDKVLLEAEMRALGLSPPKKKTKKKMKKGGLVRGAGCARQGVRKAKMR